MAKTTLRPLTSPALSEPALQGLRSIGGAFDLPTANGMERDTTAMFNPSMDHWFNALAGAENATPDANGVTHLTLGGSRRPMGTDTDAALQAIQDSLGIKKPTFRSDKPTQRF